MTTRAIPNLEAVKAAFALRKQQVGVGDRVLIRKARQHLDACDMAGSH